MTDGGPLLDQVSSQALTRLAAERGLTPGVVPAGEEVVPPLKKTWTRFLPYAFLALSMFALAGMVLASRPFPTMAGRHRTGCSSRLWRCSWSACSNRRGACFVQRERGDGSCGRPNHRSKGPPPRLAFPCSTPSAPRRCSNAGRRRRPARATTIARRKGGRWLERDFYRVDLATLTSVRLSANPSGLTTLGIGATAREPATIPGGARLPAGSVVTIEERGRDGQQAVVAFRPDSSEPIALARITPPLRGASFTGGDGRLSAFSQTGRSGA